MGHEAGKGSKQRPTNHEAYSKAWDKIFKKQGSSDTQDVKNAAPVTPTASTQTEAPTALPVKQQLS